MMRIKNIIAWLFLLVFLFNWQPLFSNQSGDGLNLPEVVVVGEDSARLEGFRDFGLLPKLAPGIKLDPVTDNLTLKSGVAGSGPGWETAETQAPGCAYRNSLTASLARGFGGAEGYYRSGRQKYIEGLLLEARSYFSEGLEKFKESELIPDFHYWLGEIDFRQERYQAARKHFAVVAKLPEHRFYHFSCYSLAWLDYREKSFAAAGKWFAIAAESRERRLASAALFWEGEALFQNAEPSAGRSVLQQLTVEYPGSAEYRAALYRLATLAFNRRDYNVALKYLRAMPAPAADSDMLQRQADLARGWCCYFTLQYSDAEMVFKQLQSEIVGVDDVVPLAFLGEILAKIKQNKLESARETFAQRPERLLKAPVAAAALRELAVAFAEAAEPETAVSLGAELITNFPVTFLQVDDFRRLARLHDELGDKQKALQTLNTGVGALLARGESEDVLVVMRLDEAQILYSAGEFEKTLAVLDLLLAEKRQIKVTADRYRVYLLLARTLNQLGNYSRTLKLLAQIPSDFVITRQADLIYERGWAALQSGNFRLADNDFSAYLKIIKENKTNTAVIQNAELNRAEALFNLHQDQQTDALLVRFANRWPQSEFMPRIRNYQGLLALRRGEFEAAAAIFTDLESAAVKVDAKLAAEILYNLGESLFSLERYPEAIAVYKKIVTKEPQLKLSGQALIRMGESYFNQGKYLKSKLVYLKAKQLWPDTEIDEKASYGLLLLAYNQDQFPYLEIEVKSFIKRFPDSSYTVPLMLLLVDLYQRQGREPDLIALLQEIETGDYAADLQLEAFFRLFKLDLKKGRKDVARSDCQRLLQRFPQSKYECDCRLYLAHYDFLKGNYKAALAKLNALSVNGCPDPDLGQEVILLKARICQQSGDYLNARKFYLEVVEKGSGSDARAFTAFVGLGDIFVHEKKFDEALFFYDKATRNPIKADAAAAHLKSAITLEASGRIGAARKLYLRISYIYPEQQHIVGEALLSALRLAIQEKDKTTAEKVTEKLNTLQLDKAQSRKFEKLTAL